MIAFYFAVVLLDFLHRSPGFPSPGIPGNDCECGWTAGPYWCSACGRT